MTGVQPPDAQVPGPPLSSLELEGRILRNTGWVALSLGASQVASLLAMFVLARLLDPKDFGLVALAWTVLVYVEQIQESGIGQALIYRREDVEAAAASALIFTPFTSILLYWVIFGIAPFAARFLHAPDLVDVLRVMALVLVFRGLAVVPRAILERNLDFRSLTIAESVATVAQIGAFLGLAVAGFGVWSLVLGNLAGAAVQTALYWLRVPWRPSVRRFSRRILRELMQYGRFIGASNFLSVVSNTVDNVVVSRVLGTASSRALLGRLSTGRFPQLGDRAHRWTDDVLGLLDSPTRSCLVSSCVSSATPASCLAGRSRQCRAVHCG